MWQQPGNPQGQNYWTQQQNMYAGASHEQVDWAALAKQWMQYKEAPVEDLTKPPPPPPDVVKPHADPPNQNQPIQSESQHSNGAASWSQDNAWSNNTNAWGDIQYRDWTQDQTYNSPSIDTGITVNYNHGEQPATEQQTFDYNHKQPSNTTDYGGYKKNEFNQQPPAAPIPGIPETQILQHAPVFHDHDLLPAAPMPAPAFDPIKKKSLPPWIREGLEKMEKEKAKKVEDERIKKEKEERKRKEELERKKKEEEAERTGIPMKSKFEEDSDEEDEISDRKSPNADNSNKSPEAEPVREKSPTPVKEQFLTPEEKMHNLMMKVKVMLTEVLLTVTNEEIYNICEQTYKSCKRKHEKAPAKMIGKSNALSKLSQSVVGYDSELSSEDESSDASNDSGSDESDSSYGEIDVKRRNFKIKQRERLEQVERAEQLALELFKNPVEESDGEVETATKPTEPDTKPVQSDEDEEDDSSSTSSDSSTEATKTEPVKTPPKEENAESVKSESKERRESARLKRSRSRSCEKERKRRSRSRDRSSRHSRRSRSRSRSRRHHKRSSSRSPKRSKRSSSSPKQKKKSRSRSRSREHRRYRSRSSERKRHRSSRKSRSRSRDRDSKKKRRHSNRRSRSRSDDRSHKRKKSRDEKKSRRSASSERSSKHKSSKSSKSARRKSKKQESSSSSSDSSDS